MRIEQNIIDEFYANTHFSHEGTFKMAREIVKLRELSTRAATECLELRHKIERMRIMFLEGDDDKLHDEFRIGAE